MKSYEIKNLPAAAKTPVVQQVVIHTPIVPDLPDAPDEEKDPRICPMAYHIKELYEATTDEEIQALLSQVDATELERHAKECISCRGSIANFNKDLGKQKRVSMIRSVMMFVGGLAGLHWLKKNL
jgi:hypothetical protein